MTNRDGSNGEPSWSPDGKEIAFISDRSGKSNIWVMPAQGGEARQLTFSPAIDAFPDWSWDGKWIIFRSNRSGKIELWRVPSAGGRAELVTERRNGYSVLSQDGKKIYFKAEEQIWEIPVDGGKERQLTDLVGKPYVLDVGYPKTDGKYIYFTSGESTGDIWVMDVEESK
jgi:Tol biopolymer transport system component